MSTAQPKMKLLQAMRSNMLLRHFSPRTIASYLSWVRRFVRFHGMRHPSDLAGADVRAFLGWLAEQRHSRGWERFPAPECRCDSRWS